MKTREMRHKINREDVIEIKNQLWYRPAEYLLVFRGDTVVSKVQQLPVRPYPVPSPPTHRPPFIIVLTVSPLTPQPLPTGCVRIDSVDGSAPQSQPRSHNLVNAKMARNSSSTRPSPHPHATQHSI